MPVAPRGETKRHVRRTAADLFRRYGYHGTGVNQILDESGAPAGSLYFHFPGGKAELATEAVTVAGNEIGRGIEYLLESSDDVAEAVGRAIDFLAVDLGESDYEHGSTSMVCSGFQSPMSNACDTMRRAGLELLQQLRAQLQVERRQQVERHDRRLADVALEQVLMQDLDPVGHAVLRDVLVGFLDALRVDVDADAARAELLRRGDDDAAVAAAEVVDDVVLGDLGGLEHRLDHVGRRRHVDDVRCPLRWLRSGSRGGAEHGGGEQHCDQNSTDWHSRLPHG